MINPARRNHWIWLGPVLAFVGAVSYFLVFVQFPALRDFPWLNLPLVILGALVSFTGLWVAAKRPRDHRARQWKVVAATLGLLLSVGLAGLFAWYIFDYSYEIPAATSLAGQTAPEFALTSDAGETVRLSDFRGKKVLLVFYRGYW
jgi:cytochrome bd-type quinol oxidase subunit 2